MALQEEEEGRGDSDLPITVEVLTAMVDRTWQRVKQLKELHPDSFTLSEFSYSFIIDMYGASQRMSQAWGHFNHMIQDLHIRPTYTVFNQLLHWARYARVS